MEPTIKRFPNSTFSLAGQFCDSDLEVAFRRNACFVRNLKGVDLLKGDRSTNLYTINFHEMASASPICLMARASCTKSWKKQKRISSIQTCSKFKAEVTPSSYGFVWSSENCKHKWKALCLGDSGRLLPLHLAIATVCFTQNRSIIHHRFNKTPYELINSRKPDISFLHVFGALCYPKNDRKDIGKLGAKADESLGKHKALELEIEHLLRAVVSDQKDTACGMSANTKFRKQSILGKQHKVGETHALSKPVTSNSIPTPQGSKVMKNVKVIAPGMFRINSFKPSREEKHMPNKVRASVRTNPITLSQPPVITKKVVNSD
uniref:Retrovirus-related Pol polyprotein from transposon TNT 1-94 n=1 Tax=Tanacetum cinerariifolium TaxID=118510 RepID=A0A699JTD2_TANCI|nr:retrovirus-related Pol polyprotein from transposon TNT 1-94 [Tanacetum cinerariifolium]